MQSLKIPTAEVKTNWSEALGVTSLHFCASMLGPKSTQTENVETCSPATFESFCLDFLTNGSSDGLKALVGNLAA